MDELLLLSGNDLPFPEARLTIHQPRLLEISYVTEQRFWLGCELLKFDKEILSNQDKVDLSNMSNFNIIMTMIQEKSLESQQARLNIMFILGLVFPTSEIILSKTAIQIRDHQTGEIKEINDSNFEIFKQILIDMFCLTNKESKQYNPGGDLAQKIVDKFKRSRAKRAKLAPKTNTKIAIFSRYISILTVGLKRDIHEFLNYTVYQLMDVFNRFMLNLKYNTWEKYKIAGATQLEDPVDWLKDIREDNNDEL